MTYRLELEPRFNYGRDDHEVAIGGGRARFRSSSATMSFASPVAIRATNLE